MVEFWGLGVLGSFLGLGFDFFWGASRGSNHPISGQGAFREDPMNLQHLLGTSVQDCSLFCCQKARNPEFQSSPKRQTSRPSNHPITPPTPHKLRLSRLDPRHRPWTLNPEPLPRLRSNRLGLLSRALEDFLASRTPPSSEFPPACPLNPQP